jgi:hypothetical protein
MGSIPQRKKNVMTTCHGQIGKIIMHKEYEGSQNKSVDAKIFVQ